MSPSLERAMFIVVYAFAMIVLALDVFVWRAV